jgi:hypothetical protein
VTPESFFGQLFKTIGRYVPPPAGLNSPALWGTRERLNELFGETAKTIQAAEKSFVWRYRSAEHWLAMWRESYGPLHKAFESLSEDLSDQSSSDILALIARFNIAEDGTMVVPAGYLEVVVTTQDPQ